MHLRNSPLGPSDLHQSAVGRGQRIGARPDLALNHATPSIRNGANLSLSVLYRKTEGFENGANRCDCRGSAQAETDHLGVVAKVVVVDHDRPEGQRRRNLAHFDLRALDQLGDESGHGIRARNKLRLGVAGNRRHHGKAFLHDGVFADQGDLSGRDDHRRSERCVAFTAHGYALEIPQPFPTSASFRTAWIRICTTSISAEIHTNLIDDVCRKEDSRTWRGQSSLYARRIDSLSRPNTTRVASASRPSASSTHRAGARRHPIRKYPLARTTHAPHAVDGVRVRTRPRRS